MSDWRDHFHEGEEYTFRPSTWSPWRKIGITIAAVILVARILIGIHLHERPKPRTMPTVETAATDTEMPEIDCKFRRSQSIDEIVRECDSSKDFAQHMMCLQQNRHELTYCGISTQLFDAALAIR